MTTHGNWYMSNAIRQTIELAHTRHSEEQDEKKKVYKFRPLANRLEENEPFADEEDFKRAKCILETGEFWCSQFWKLNDPMEGIFRANEDIISKIYEEKKQCRICSFSDIWGFKKPIMWGYYANGFKGMAIEIEVEVDKECLEGKKCFRPMSYNDEIPEIEDKDDSWASVIEILTHKSTRWKHEREYRFLKKTNKNFCKIGQITAIYFGNPYGNASNRSDILKDDNNLVEYDKWKNKLIKIADKNFNYHDVSVNGEGVVS